MPDLPAWVRTLGQVEIPVLARTVEEIERLRRNEEAVTPRDISRVIEHDPMFAARVLRQIQSRRRHSQPTEITTVEHALMMLGVSPFFRQFDGMAVVEDVLRSYPQAYGGLMQAMSRAHHAATYARDWAALRHDIEADEVAIAALLHDLAEIVLWCFAPEPALRIRQMMMEDRTMRSGAAQHAVLGFRLTELQLALVADWQLPALLQSLMDDTHAAQPRVRNVTLAVNLARHSAYSWYDPALPDDYAEIERLLSLPQEEVVQRIYRVALRAKQDAHWFEARLSSAWRPGPPA